MPVVVVTSLPPALIELFRARAWSSLLHEWQEDDLQYEGWYCINIKPAKCDGCGNVVAYLEPPHFHLIVVWQEKDDEKLLEFAVALEEQGLEPRIETYHPILGSCVPWEFVEQLYEEGE